MEDYRRRPDGTVHHTTDSGNYPSVEQHGYMKRYTCTTSQKTLDQNNVNPEKMLTFQYLILHINTQQHFIFFHIITTSLACYLFILDLTATDGRCVDLEKL